MDCGSRSLRSWIADGATNDQQNAGKSAFRIPGIWNVIQQLGKMGGHRCRMCGCKVCSRVRGLAAKRKLLRHGRLDSGCEVCMFGFRIQKGSESEMKLLRTASFLLGR